MLSNREDLIQELAAKALEGPVVQTEEGIGYRYLGSQVALVVKNPPANAADIRDSGFILGQEDPLEEGMATPSSILAWRIPWTEEPVGYSSWGLTESNRTERLSFQKLLLPIGLEELNEAVILRTTHNCSSMHSAATGTEILELKPKSILAPAPAPAAAPYPESLAPPHLPPTSHQGSSLED